MICFEINLFIFTDYWVDPLAKLEAFLTYCMGQIFLLYDSNHHALFLMLFVCWLYISLHPVSCELDNYVQSMTAIGISGMCHFPDVVVVLFLMTSTFLFLSMYQTPLIFLLASRPHTHTHIILIDCIEALFIAKVLIFSSL